MNNGDILKFTPENSESISEKITLLAEKYSKQLTQILNPEIRRIFTFFISDLKMAGILLESGEPITYKDYIRIKGDCSMFYDHLSTEDTAIVDQIIIALGKLPIIDFNLRSFDQTEDKEDSIAA